MHLAACQGNLRLSGGVLVVALEIRYPHPAQHTVGVSHPVLYERSRTAERGVRSRLHPLLRDRLWRQRPRSGPRNGNLNTELEWRLGHGLPSVALDGSL